MVGAVGAEVLRHLGRVRDELLALEVRPLAVEHAEGVAFVAHATVGAGFAQAPFVVFFERREVLGPARRVADAVDGEGEAPQSKGRREPPAEVDDLRVHGRVAVADGLYAELVMLAQASRLGTFVSEDGAEVVHAHGLGPGVHAVLKVRSAYGRGAFRAERDLLTAAVREGVRLLLDDVGALAHPALEEARVLKHWSVDLPIAKSPGLLTRDGRDVIPVRLVLRESVLSAPGKAELHGDFLRCLDNMTLASIP